MSTAKWSHSLFLKCPTCGKGDLYTSKSSFDFKNFLNMHQKCTVCSEDFVVETGFYQGAMYISYILSCALCLSILPIYYLFNISWEKFLDNAMYYLVASFIVLILSAPYITKLSRAIWLTIHVKFFKNNNF